MEGLLPRSIARRPPTHHQERLSQRAIVSIQALQRGVAVGGCTYRIETIEVSASYTQQSPLAQLLKLGHLVNE